MLIKILTLVCATLLLVDSARGQSAEERRRADLCKQMLAAFAKGEAERVVDFMLESAPRSVTSTKEVEEGIPKLQAALREAYEHTVRNNGGGRVQDREPLPEQRMGQSIAVLERWDFGNGHKPYAGCVPYASDGQWLFNIQVSRDPDFVTGKLREAAAGNPYPAPAPTTGKSPEAGEPR